MAKCNVTFDLSQFVKTLDDVKDTPRKCANALGREYLNVVTKMTPTVTGTLKQRWKIGKNESFDGGYRVVVSNNTYYASYFDSGHRIVRNGEVIGWCEGKHITTKAKRLITNNAQTICEKEFE